MRAERENFVSKSKLITFPTIIEHIADRLYNLHRSESEAFPYSKKTWLKWRQLLFENVDT